MAVPVLRININQIALSDSNNNNNNNASGIRTSTRKCLFGPADPNETYQLIQEQFRSERQRFFERFGIDMEDLENVAVGQQPKKRRSCPEKLKVSHEKTSRQMRVLKPYNAQTKMTDYCQIKKSAVTLQKKLRD